MIAALSLSVLPRIAEVAHPQVLRHRRKGLMRNDHYDAVFEGSRDWAPAGGRSGTVTQDAIAPAMLTELRFGGFFRPR